MTRAAAEGARLLGTKGSYLRACLAAVPLAAAGVAVDVCGGGEDDFDVLVAKVGFDAGRHDDFVGRGRAARGEAFLLRGRM